MNCLLCGKETRFVFSRGHYKIFECAFCGHRMTDILTIDVQGTYSDAYFCGGAGEYLDYISEKDLLVARGHYYSRVLSRFVGRPGKLLDVGAAAGFVLQGFVENGWDGTGLEPNRWMVRYGQTSLGLNMRLGTIESYSEKEKYSLISLVQVIAHFPDPQRSLGACLDHLEQGGHMLVETWDWQSRTARLFGRHWHEYNPPYVLQWFSRGSLHRLMAGLGMRLLAGGCPRKKILGQHAKFLIQRKLSEFSWVAPVRKAVSLIPDRAALSYPGGDLFWEIYQKQPGKN